jgi:soluble lytic murein transglycosylase-like protein
MARGVEIVMLGGALGFGLYEVYRRMTATTAGDEESNAFTDTVESMKSQINGGWPSGSDPYRSTIQIAAATHGVPASILAWLLWKESRYIPAIINGTRRSSAGAMGIAQFMPATAREELGSVEAALDPARAIPGAARYLAKLHRSLGSWDKALAAYNWGIGNVQRRGMAAAPAETRDYYTSILGKSGYQAGAYA